MLMRALRANRSLAAIRSGRPLEALADALVLVAEQPSWAKGHYRAGQALLALRLHEEAVAALAAAANIEPGECSTGCCMYVLLRMIDAAIHRTDPKQGPVLAPATLVMRNCSWLRPTPDESAPRKSFSVPHRMSQHRESPLMYELQHFVLSVFFFGGTPP